MIGSFTLEDIQLSPLEQEVPLLRLIKLAGDNCHSFAALLGEKFKLYDHFRCRMWLPVSKSCTMMLHLLVKFDPDETTLEVKSGADEYVIQIRPNTDEKVPPKQVSEAQEGVLRAALVYLLRGAEVNLAAEVS